jgi:hypothetical protein
MATVSERLRLILELSYARTRIFVAERIHRVRVKHYTKKYGEVTKWPEAIRKKMYRIKDPDMHFFRPVRIIAVIDRIGQFASGTNAAFTEVGKVFGDCIHLQCLDPDKMKLMESFYYITTRRPIYDLMVKWGDVNPKVLPFKYLPEQLVIFEAWLDRGFDDSIEPIFGETSNAKPDGPDGENAV